MTTPHPIIFTLVKRPYVLRIRARASRTDPQGGKNTKNTSLQANRKRCRASKHSPTPPIDHTDYSLSSSHIYGGSITTGRVPNQAERGSTTPQQTPPDPTLHVRTDSVYCSRLVHSHMNLYTQKRTPRAQTNVKRCWGARAVPPARRPGRVFRSKTTTPNTRCVSLCFPKYPTGASTHQHKTTHIRLVSGYAPQLVHGRCLPPIFCRARFSGAKRRLPTHGVCR
jgi:hypothetical protein